MKSFNIEEPSLKKSSPKKYSSLQGLRGIAIILVIIFHLNPKLFKNGFVGVDIFFVLSGFLMAKILNKKLDVSTIRMFYEKRFKRIVPLYFVTILLTTIGVLAFVIRPERSDFIEDVKWSLLIIFNYKPIFEHQTYWDQISTFRYLTHLWSLCVELQYYLIAPIIQLISSHLPFNLRVIGHVITIAISCIFQYQMPFELSYSFLFARVWQFLLGSLTFELTKTENGSSSKEGKSRIASIIFSTVFLISICLVMGFPAVLSESLTRLLLSFFVVFICAYRESLESSFLTWKPLMFIGDISFVLYLVHWPVIKFVQYIQINETGSMSLIEVLLAVSITVFLSFVLHYTLERRFIQMDFIISFATVVLCVGLTVSASSWLKTDECWMQHTLSEDVQNRIVWTFNSSNIFKKFEDFPCDKNEKNNRQNISALGQEYNYCRVMSKGVGKKLVIGNSLALRAFPYLIEKFDKNYEELRLFSRTGSAPLLNIAPHYTEECQKMVKWYKPDLLWIIQGMNELESPGASKSLPKDRSLLGGTMQSVLNKMKNHAGMVYIDLPYYVSSKNTISNIAKSLIYRHDLDEIASYDLKEVDRQIGLQSLRLQSLNCSNCFNNDINKALVGNDSKLYDYERNTYRPIVYDGAHLSWTAFEKLDELYQNAVDRFNNFVKNNKL